MISTFKISLFHAYRVLLCSLTLITLMAGCGGGGGGNTNPTPPPYSGTPKWTYLVYMAGDNNLAPAALMDLQEMETVGSTSAVNVVVQAKLNPAQLINAGLDATLANNIGNSVYRAKIVKNNSPANTLLASNFQAVAGVSNMADKATLTGFITWAKQNYPADNYALVLWSHGNGWKTIPISQGLPTRGALADDTSGSTMTMQDITTAIKNSGTHFGVINFDACLMAMYEVAYSLKDAADYLVASEEVEPGQGDDYNRVLTSLTGTPAQTPNQVAQMVATKFRDSYAALTPQGKDNVTKSAVDLTKLAALKTALDDFAAYLTANLAGSGTLRPSIQAARNASTTLSFNKTNRDLGLFLSALKNQPSGDTTLSAKITAVQSALTAAVIKNESYSPATSAALTVSGLSIFLPVEGDYLDTDLAAYQALGATLDSAGWKWHLFLSQLLTGTTPPSVGTRGDFGFAISWTDPAIDLDLYISEPNGLASPWIGTTSANAYLTADSAASNSSYEAYAAQTTVASGLYDLFIHNVSGKAATVTIWYTDSTNPAYATWQPIRTVQLKDVSTPGCAVNPSIIPDTQTHYNDLSTNAYCDWVYYQGVLAMNNTLTLSPATPLVGKIVFSPVNSKFRLLKNKPLSTGAPLNKNISSFMLLAGGTP
jgi:hypothetical protein